MADERDAVEQDIAEITRENRHDLLVPLQRSMCPWRVDGKKCVTGCRDEPACETQEPAGGWGEDMQSARQALAEEGVDPRLLYAIPGAFLHGLAEMLEAAHCGFQHCSGPVPVPIDMRTCHRCTALGALYVVLAVGPDDAAAKSPYFPAPEVEPLLPLDIGTFP